MLERDDTVFPVEIVDKLDEFEKLLIHPGYGAWRRRKILEQVDIEDLTYEERLWVEFLERFRHSRGAVCKFIFDDLKRDAVQFKPSEKALIKFLIRVSQKQPEHADRAIRMFDHS